MRRSTDRRGSPRGGFGWVLAGLVATAAANTGIDQPQCNMVLRLGIPRTIVEMLQERGRIRCGGVFSVYSDWAMLVKLILSILRPRSSDSDELRDIDYVHSTITAKTPESRKRKREEADDGELSVDISRPLTANAKRNNIVRDYNDVVNSCNFLFLPGFEGFWTLVEIRLIVLARCGEGSG